MGEGKEDWKMERLGMRRRGGGQEEEWTTHKKREQDRF